MFEDSFIKYDLDTLYLYVDQYIEVLITSTEEVSTWAMSIITISLMSI